MKATTISAIRPKTPPITPAHCTRCIVLREIEGRGKDWGESSHFHTVPCIAQISEVACHENVVPVLPSCAYAVCSNNCEDRLIQYPPDTSRWIHANVQHIIGRQVAFICIVRCRLRLLWSVELHVACEPQGGIGDVSGHCSMQSLMRCKWLASSQHGNVDHARPSPAAKMLDLESFFANDAAEVHALMETAKTAKSATCKRQI